jgi:hypothetical protein
MITPTSRLFALVDVTYSEVRRLPWPRRTGHSEVTTI